MANGYRGLKAKSCEETDTGHGWSEVRRCWQSADFKWVPASQAWAGAKGVARVECERHLGDKVSREVRVYISSLPGEPVRHLGAVRGHGGIENRLHWVSRRDFPGGLQPSPSGACGRESHRAPTNGAQYLSTESAPEKATPAKFAVPVGTMTSATRSCSCSGQVYNALALRKGAGHRSGQLQAFITGCFSSNLFLRETPLAGVSSVPVE